VRAPATDASSDAELSSEIWLVLSWKIGVSSTVTVPMMNGS
jgi:hypothetical protein